MWRRAGLPQEYCAAKGMLARPDVRVSSNPVVWSDRLEAAYVERWAALRRDRNHAGYYNLVHDRELNRLRAERDALERARKSGINGIFRGLKARAKRYLRKPPG
jgi:hypothetical protein